MGKPFVPPKFEVPEPVKTTDFILRKLTTKDVEQDYEAVMSSKESLRQIFAKDDDWPADDMTIESNYEDLEYHEREFNERKSFAYTMRDVDDSRCIGCVYIYPWFRNGADAVIYYWVIDSEKAKGLDKKVGSFLRDGINKVWPIENPVYPGRDITWEAWEVFKEKNPQKSD
ncbi:MAG: GNAT family N-acetyltransferase [Chloroflexi bacterium]|nr:GNAT family N-acetyltransferase [Chloroflexota bacterium]